MVHRWCCCLTLLIVLLPQLVDAFPTGAGGCKSGNPLEGFHLARPQTTGSLARGGFELLLNGRPLATTTVGTFPQSGVTNILTLRAANDIAEFRGFLIRVDYGNGATAGLLADSMGQNSSFCVTESVSGVTHTDNMYKRSASAEMITEGIITGQVSVEVTVVVENSRNLNSVWYYSSYKLRQQAVPGGDFPFAFKAFPGYQEPPFFQFYENVLGNDVAKRCVKRKNPPVNGELCREKPKACFFGSQQCSRSSAGQIQPETRCNCKNDTWSCQKFMCPTIGPVCPSLDPLILTPSFVCSSDLSCDIFEQRCCGFTIPEQTCTCETGQPFTCTIIPCPDDCSTFKP